MERHLFKALLAMGFEWLDYFFRQLGTGDPGPQVLLPDDRVLKRLEGLRERRYQSVFGEFYGVRDKQVFRTPRCTSP